MAHTETMLESREIFNGRVIRVTGIRYSLRTARPRRGRSSTTTAAPASCLWTPTAA